jgi:hypothetical protein
MSNNLVLPLGVILREQPVADGKVKEPGTRYSGSIRIVVQTVTQGTYQDRPAKHCLLGAVTCAGVKSLRRRKLYYLYNVRSVCYAGHRTSSDRGEIFQTINTLLAATFSTDVIEVL